MIPGVLLATLLAGAAVAYGAPAAPMDEDAPAPSRNVDVTMICTTVAQFGIRELTFSASPRVVTTTFDRPALISVGTGAAGATETLAGAEARGSSGRARGGIWIHRRRCARTGARVPLSREGLAGPPTLHGRAFECGAPRRVILRLRATLRSRGPWVIAGEDRQLRVIQRNVVSAAAAVRTWPGRKPLGFVSFDARERTKLWAAAGCS